MRILVLGGRGYLGSFFVGYCHSIGQSVVSVSTATFAGFSGRRIESYSERCLFELFSSERPEVVLNTVALADVDQCETDPVLAEEMNTALPEALARLSGRLNFQLIHISTDQLWGTVRVDPFDRDYVSPVNVYGQTKAEGERRILNNCTSAVVVRVNFFHRLLAKDVNSGREKISFFPWVLQSYEDDLEICGFDDIVYTPLFSHDLCDFILFAAHQKLYGLFEIGCSEPITKYGFIKKVWEHLDQISGNHKSGLVKPLSLDQAQLVARRPKNMCLHENVSASGFKFEPSIELAIRRSLIGI